ncbi:nuclear speckle RNA-binding protein A-like [Salvia divinorum]|uniref:Nuclear speckle RNA-binding protein A-like n=1 Tax=Salvia divinorum TaxID=28513 RepID=A0ABD1FJP8_SALDI
MADAFWRYGDNRQPAASLPSQMVSKRTRSEFEVPSGQATSSYYVPGNERAGTAASATDVDYVNASYERYLRDLQVRVQVYGGQTARPATVGLDGLHEIDDLRVLGLMQPGSAAAARSRLMGVGGRPEISLPADTSSTLFVEGLPANCTRREVSHIFRPFVGYKEVRLVTKAPRHPGGDPVVLSFVDFESPAHAATAMDALQDYLFDEHERDSAHLRVQFARNPPGTRVGGGHRGNH